MIEATTGVPKNVANERSASGSTAPVSLTGFASGISGAALPQDQGFEGGARVAARPVSPSAIYDPVSVAGAIALAAYRKLTRRCPHADR